MTHHAIPSSIRKALIAHLAPLIGLPITAGRRAADMRILQFGALRPVDGGSVGDFALHIQCPWRIEGPEGIVTGRADLWEPVEQGPDFDLNKWDYDRSPNLQDCRFQEWLERNGPALIVKSVEADNYGGAAVVFENGFVLRLFPAGTQGEDWRLFAPQSGAPHFVVIGGQISN
jgi:hypothetical protein